MPRRRHVVAGEVEILAPRRFGVGRLGHEFAVGVHVSGAGDGHEAMVVGRGLFQEPLRGQGKHLDYGRAERPADRNFAALGVGPYAALDVRPVRRRVSRFHDDEAEIDLAGAELQGAGPWGRWRNRASAAVMSTGMPLWKLRLSCQLQPMGPFAVPACPSDAAVFGHSLVELGGRPTSR